MLAYFFIQHTVTYFVFKVKSHCSNDTFSEALITLLLARKLTDNYFHIILTELSEIFLFMLVTVFSHNVRIHILCFWTQFFTLIIAVSMPAVRFDVHKNYEGPCEIVAVSQPAVALYTS